ncbi:MAG: CHAT domain-containing protein, partial [Candidatus Methylumidiphilus sp.]
MINEIQIRTVTVELLRAGPAHNQLLSPLTQYLGICGFSGAGIVTLPHEHATFLRRTNAMHYDGGADKERQAVLRDLGLDIAKVLGSVPNLPGALTAGGAAETLVHLRLTLTASELALLPFELSKVPINANSADESWLALQTAVPVCITRRSRNVASEGVRLPEVPRILFIASNPDSANIPYDEHRKELIEAVKPFLYPDEFTEIAGKVGEVKGKLSLDDRREQFGNWLTIIKDAGFDEVVAECAAVQYTHIHILAHGDKLPNAEDTAYGLVLRGAGADPDLVSGERLASAFARIVGDKIHRPTLVSLATCDSANPGSVIIPVASLAHALHLAGVPLVVASQFPLSKKGSIEVAKALYPGLLRGKNPWILLHSIRSDLHARFADSNHDWASLVVYEALPDNLEEQLEEVRYHQGKRANKAALVHMERAIPIKESVPGPNDLEIHGRFAQTVKGTFDQLPMDGKFSAECLGLRASSHKQLAQAKYQWAKAMSQGSTEYHDCLLQHYDDLEQARIDYQQAARSFLVNEDKPLQHIAQLHWVLVQTLSLTAVLGKSMPAGFWETAKLSAEAYLDHSLMEERAWAHGSLAELYLLHLADCTPETRAAVAQEAIKHIKELVKLVPADDPFPIESTRKQFERYVDWWGQPAFEATLVEWGGENRPDWNGKDGIVETAKAVVADHLTRGKPRSRPTPATQTQTLAQAEKPVAATVSTEGKLSPTAKPAAKGKPIAASAFLEQTQDSGGEAFLDIKMLPAGHGDCLWLQYGKGQSVSRVLIDCGTDSTYKPLKEHMLQLPESQRNFELFILSHIDADHIGGAIPFFKDQSLGVSFADVWFNGWKHLPSDKLGAKQGEIFSTLIQQYKLPWNQWRGGESIMLEGDELPVCTLPGGMTLTLLSPSKDKLATLAKKWKKEIEDLGLTAGKATDFTQFLRGTPSTSTDAGKLADAPFKADAAAPNGSSIAVLAEYQGKSILLGA